MTAKPAMLLDRIDPQRAPSLATDADVRRLEAVPWTDRVAAASTYDALRGSAAHDGAALAMRFLPNADPDEPSVDITHAQFFERVTQTANLFHELGVGPGDVVSFLLPLVPQAFFTLFGAEAAGIANPVNPLLEPHQIAEILQAAGTRVLVALGPTPGTDIWEKVQQIRGTLPNLKAVVQVGGGATQPGAIGFDEAVARQPADRLVSGRRIAAGDIAAYFHTGGTTGTPKLVRHTHGNQVYQAWVINLVLGNTPGHATLYGLPLFHVGGALTQGLATLANGGCVVVLSPAGWRNPQAVRNAWRLVAKFRPNAFGGVPTVLVAASAIPTGDADVSSIRGIFGGGSAIPVAVGRALFERFRVPVQEVYGMTETSSVHTLSLADRELRIGSVGHPVPYSRVRVVKIGADGACAGDCAVGEIGVVAMAGPGVFGGYLNDEHNRGAFVEPGWVNSGDLGRLDAEGYLWITGRAKDLIIRGGHNIDPTSLEDLFYQHPDVAFAAVVGQPDAYAGELPLAYVQMKPGAKAAPAELHEYIRARTPERAAVPVQVIPVDTIPLTAVGKVFKPQLRWDAATRVFDATLAPLRDRGVDVRVVVGPHGTHGSLASVTVAGVPAAQRDAVAADIDRLLDPFVIRHATAWT